MFLVLVWQGVDLWWLILCVTLEGVLDKINIKLVNVK